MSEANNIQHGELIELSQGTLVGMITESQQLLDQSDSSIIGENNERLAYLNHISAIIFTDMGIKVRVIDPEDRPISAHYDTACNIDSSKWKLQNGLFIKGHPKKAKGTITSVNLAEGKLQVRPDYFSPYRFDHGRFIIDLLTEDYEPRVEMKLYI